LKVRADTVLVFTISEAIELMGYHFEKELVEKIKQRRKRG